MAEPTKITSQVRFTGNGPVDYKFNPVNTMSDLPNPFVAYEGQIVTVLNDNDGRTAEYQFVEGTWVPKESLISINGGTF